VQAPPVVFFSDICFTLTLFFSFTLTLFHSFTLTHFFLKSPTTVLHARPGHGLGSMASMSAQLLEGTGVDVVSCEACSGNIFVLITSSSIILEIHQLNMSCKILNVLNSDRFLIFFFGLFFGVLF
jgi:hypothetical protein